MKNLLFLILLFASFQTVAQQQPLRVIVIGAHPDDADLCAGGTAAQWAAMGHQVKFLSLTNGDAGHQNMGGGALAKRRRAEAEESARRLGIDEYEVLDNHDGELIPSLDVRLQVIRRIRQWKADVVITSRPNDYHPDHRNTGLVVQDAAYMVIVPNVASDTPPLEKNPVFLYCEDSFQKPNPFKPDIAVNIDPVAGLKVDGADAHVSQFYEWLPWTVQALDQVPADKTARKRWLTNWLQGAITPETKTSLEKWYGKETAAKIRNAEVFEICEYGRQPDESSIRKLFPMLGANTPFAKAVKTAEPIKLDGKLDEPVYQKATKIYLNDCVTLGAIEDPAYTTYVQVFYDETTFYVAFHCNDKDIHSRYTRRDDRLWEEEAVEVFIDMDATPSNYVEIEVSPKNILYDSYIVDPQKIDVPRTSEFNLPGIRTAASVDGTTDNRKDTDRSWSVEIAIPFADLDKNFSADQLKSYNWKINFYRINEDGTPLQYMAWSQMQGSFHQPDKFGRIIFR
jgi:LmbE family N-acetylglucosaminyl deacetylase